MAALATGEPAVPRPAVAGLPTRGPVTVAAAAGAGRPGGPGDSYRDRPAPRPGGDGPARRPAAAADYQPRGSAGGGGRHGGGRGRSDWEQDPRDAARPDSRYRGGGAAPGGRGPRGGARPERGSGQVAQDLRERLGVRGGRGAGPAGGADDWDGRRAAAAGHARRSGTPMRATAGAARARGAARATRARTPVPAVGAAGAGAAAAGMAGRAESAVAGASASGSSPATGGAAGPGRRSSACSAAGCLLLILLVAGAFLYAYESITMPTDVAAAALSQPSTVYYSNGKPMASFSGNGVSHVILQPSQIPKVMDEAITAAEDRSFYTEGGISITGLARAVYEDLKGGSYLQGGSTLTEQFVKNYYTGFSSTDNTDKTLTDKLKQVIVAIKLAHLKSKSWIITQYLNTVSFGPQAYGVGAAAADLLQRAGQQAHRPAGRDAGRAGQRCPACSTPTRTPAPSTPPWWPAGSTCSTTCTGTATSRCRSSRS